jgi:hypothetical protein
MGVQMSRLAEIRKEWKQLGNPQCDHASTDREYYLGTQTGDIGCLDCGETWWEGGKPRRARE